VRLSFTENIAATKSSNHKNNRNEAKFYFPHYEAGRMAKIAGNDKQHNRNRKKENFSIFRFLQSHQFSIERLVFENLDIGSPQPSQQAVP
jgi:hypothetical protein